MANQSLVEVWVESTPAALVGFNGVVENRSWQQWPPGIIFRTDGCWINGTHDCFAACYDPEIAPKMVWNDIYGLDTLQSCMLYPIAVTLMQEGMLPVGNITTGLNILNESSLGMSGSLAWSVINNCTTSYCQQTTGSEAGCQLDPSTFPVYQVTEDLQFTIVSNDAHLTDFEKAHCGKISFSRLIHLYATIWMPQLILTSLVLV